METKILIKLFKQNESYLRIDADRSVLQEISEHFSFKATNYQFMPSYKSGYWDGTVRLFNVRNKLLPFGLLESLKDFAKEFDHQFEVDPDLFKQVTPRTITRDMVNAFIKSLKIPFEPRDYQIDTMVHALNNNRLGFLSPTSSGKSFMIYVITQYMIQQGREVLIIVPLTGLVVQMDNDFTEYNNGVPMDTHCIMGGVDKSPQKAITITTWQSLIKMPKVWSSRFDCVIGDEAHLYEAKSLSTIMDNLEATKYRYGFTGTLKDSLTNKMVLEGHFGRFITTTTSKEMMDNGYAAQLKIEIISLKYNDDDCKLVRKEKDYQKELTFINSHSKRNKFILDLVMNTTGNTLILFHRVDTHGKQIFQMIKDAIDPDTEVFYVHGKVKTEEREIIRKYVDNHKKKRVIVVASSGTFSTGMNMKKIHNIMFVSPTKSKITTLQSIGRGLRLDGDTNKVKLYDIVDDIRIGKYENYSFKHFMERVKYYDSEQFEYRINTFKLK